MPAAPWPLPAGEVELVPSAGSLLLVGDRHHGGVVRVSWHDDGVAVAERVDVDEYLLGIREVPFSWPQEALRAQVVAARTYLAWTLGRGRSTAASRYGYDICATDACQVYAGLDAVLGPRGEAWRRAVESTEGQILVWGGEPAQALYSSTSGGRTRSVEDVFPGAPPTPYLRAVESPGEDSPFARWSFRVPAAHLASILSEAGVLEGELRGVRTETTPDGAGPWRVVLEGERTETMSTWELRSVLNRFAPRLFPDHYPARRGDGRRYPQVILSPTYTLQPARSPIRAEERDPPVVRASRGEEVYRVRGRGWGHLVGMSQYGAEAMARRGADADDILAHYYGGLTPVPAGPLLPEEVTVGLEVAAEEVRLRPLGPVDVVVDGVVVAERVLGSWTVQGVDGRMLAMPPPGLGQAPRIEALRLLPARGGLAPGVSARLTAPAEVRVTVEMAGRLIFDSGREVLDPGEVAWEWEQVGLPAVARPAVVTVTARSPQGFDIRQVVVVPMVE